MKIIDCTDADYKQTLQSLYTRPACPPEIEERAQAIVDEVRAHGDAAVLSQIAKFDRVILTSPALKVSDEEIAAAKKAVSRKTKSAIKLALGNITAFAKMQVFRCIFFKKSRFFSTAPPPRRGRSRKNRFFGRFDWKNAFFELSYMD